MNNSKDLSKRLLKLFPVDVLKDYFNKKGKSSDLITEIVETNKSEEIATFAIANFNYTKQHVYFFESQKPIAVKNIDIGKLPTKIIKSAVANGVLTLYCLPVVKFDVIVLNDYEEVEIRFQQPIKITVADRYVIFQCTTLEKDLSSYFSTPNKMRKVVNSERRNGEDEIINGFVDFFNNNLSRGVIVWPLEKGIKAIWETNVIDSKYAKQKKPKSTSTEAMDEEYLLKDIYPEIYKELIKNPLIKTLFKYKKKDDLLPDHFNADPQRGMIGISSFPEHTHQIENLINEIVKNNK